MMLLEILALILVFGSAIILHEVAHGWVALQLGDSTAKDLGRLTLNPLKHMDPVGSVVLPGVLIFLRSLGYPVVPIGWAKPVPVNFMQLRNPRESMMWVALAGPVTNILLAVAASFWFRFQPDSPFSEFVALMVFINILLAVFNMVPIPPLDGSRVLMRFLPKSIAVPYSRLEPYGILIVFVLLYLGLFEVLVLPIVFYLASLLGVRIL